MHSATVFISGTRLDPNSNILQIVGTDEADIVKLKSKDGGETIEVETKLGKGKKQKTFFSRSDIEGIVIHLGDGDDKADLDQKITIDAIIYGGDGKDKLKGGSGNDTLIGGPGDDDLKGYDGNDRLVGNDGDDKLKGDKGDDFLLGGPGEDDLYGRDGADVLVGGWGSDKLKGGKGTDVLIGGYLDRSYATLPELDTLSDWADGLLESPVAVAERFGPLGEDAARDDLKGGKDDDLLFGQPSEVKDSKQLVFFTIPSSPSVPAGTTAAEGVATQLYYAMVGWQNPRPTDDEQAWEDATASGGSPLLRRDVNADGTVDPLDALQVINIFNRMADTSASIHDLPEDAAGFYDVDGSMVVTPADALAVINWLHRIRPNPAIPADSLPPSPSLSSAKPTRREEPQRLNPSETRKPPRDLFHPENKGTRSFEPVPELPEESTAVGTGVPGWSKVAVDVALEDLLDELDW